MNVPGLRPSALFSLSILTTLLFADTNRLSAAPLLEPDHTIWGSATVNGQLAPEGTLVEVFLADQGAALDRFVIGSEPNLGDRYALRLPLSSEDPRIPGTSRPGDAIEIYLDGALAAETTVGGAGDTQRIDLDPFFDDPPDLSIEGDEVTEGDAGTTDAVFTVRLSRPVDFEVTVNYATVDGTAMSGSDFTATQGTLLLEAGFVQGQIRVPVLGDTEVEPPEQFTVELSDPGVANVLVGAATATIDADDARWLLRIEDTSVLEGDGGETEAVFTVTASFEVPGESGPSGASLSADYATLPGSAQEGLDFLPTSGTLLIDASINCPDYGLPCTTIAVPVLTDQERESDESFSMQLSLPIPNLEDIAIADAEGIATILNDEHLLVFQEAQLDPLPLPTCDGECLRGASAVSVYAEDGVPGQVYVTSEISSSLVVFDRSPIDGTLTALQVLRDVTPSNQSGTEGLGGASAVLADPAGSWVWAAAAADDRLLVFAREANGSLTLHQTVEPTCAGGAGSTIGFAGPRGLTRIAGADGVYVLGADSDSISLYRDAGDGTLICEQVVVDGQELTSGAVDGLRGATDAVVSPTGDFLYVASVLDAAVVIFALDPATGRIVDYVGRFKDGDGIDGIDGASSLAIVGPPTQDPGAGPTFLYVAGSLDDAVVWFEQDPTTGELTYAGRRRDGQSGVRGLVGPASLAITDDPLRSRLLAASRFDDAVVLFDRDPLTGTLDFAEVRRNGDPDPNGPIDGLAGARSVVLSPWTADEGRNLYVAGFSAPGLAVFGQDMTPPDLPIFTDPAPSGQQTGIWSNQRVIEAEWISDDGPGLGLDGYVVQWDLLAGTELGTSLDLQPATSPQLSTSQPLADAADHYLHVRACDRAGNCSATAHQGPFLIDGTLPELAAPLTAQSTVPGQVDLSWGAASDGASGVLELRARVSTSPGASCASGDPDTVVLPATATTHSRTVADGTWWSSLCVVDQAGNQLLVDTASVIVDTTPPRVTAVGSVRATQDGLIENGDRLAWGPTQLVVTFDEQNLDSANDIESYRWLGAGANGAIETNGCGSLLGDDVTLPLGSPAFDRTLQSAVLPLAQATPAGRGHYRLVVCSAELIDDFGNALDGDGDGTAGDDFVLDFEVTRTNLLTNPHFDDSIDGWTATLDSDFLFDTEDADSAWSSGSAFLTHQFQAGEFQELSQCVPLNRQSHLSLEAAGRWVWPQITGPFTAIDITFFDRPDCAGNPLLDSLGSGLGGDTHPIWLKIPPRQLETPVGAQSARFRLTVFGEEFGEVWLDNAFVGDPLVIFLDGFESGGTQAWSSVVP